MYNKKETVRINLYELKEHPKNPKLHDEQLIEKSLRDLGYVENIIIDENNTILAGHGRVKVLKKRGVSEEEVVRITGWTDEEKEEYLLLSNQTTISGGFNFEELKKINTEILNYFGFENYKIDSSFPKIISNEEKATVKMENLENLKANPNSYRTHSEEKIKKTKYNIDIIKNKDIKSKKIKDIFNDFNKR